MDDEVLAKVTHFFASYPLRTFASRQVLVHANETPQSVFYIVEGRVSQYDITPTGNEMVVNVFKPGAFFPMSSVINSTPNPYYFEASADTTVRQAPGNDAVQFLRDNPDVTFDLLARVYRGTDGVLRRMAHLMGGDAHSRLVFELLNAASRFGSVRPDGSVHIPLKEGDLAKQSGLARETVNRCLQSLKAAGLAHADPAGIVVTQVSKLEAHLGSAL